MKPLTFPPGLQDAIKFPFFFALQARRSRRFSLGAEIPDGPLKYASKNEAIPLSDIEQQMILAAVAGNTGWHFMIPWSEANAPYLPRYSNAAGGRTFPCTVPTMFVRTFLQAHHLELDFYDTFFEPGAYLETHRSHLAKWHGTFPKTA
jgi:hypothetical protein